MKDTISQDIKHALKNRETEKLSTLRMILAELQRKEKEKGVAVDEDAAKQILQSMVRKRKEAIEQFIKGARQDLADKEQREIEFIKHYLPEQLSENQVREHVLATISELGVRSPKEMGKIMGALMKKLSGQSDGGLVSRIVKEELQKLES